MNEISQGAYAATTDTFDRTMSGLKDSVAAATTGIEQAQATMRDGMQKAMKTVEGMIAFTQGNVDAVTQSGQIMATAVQDMGHSITAAARASADDTVHAFKAMTAVKSVKEAVDLQTNLFRSMMERAVSQSSQMTHTTMKLSEQAMAPITARLAVATESFGRIA